MVATSKSGNASASQAGMAACRRPRLDPKNSLLAYVRTQEDQADRAGVKFLTASGQSPKGMHDTFKRLADQLLYSARYMDPYMQSHPMPTERVRALEETGEIQARTGTRKGSPAFQARHDFMRAKLFGFIDRPDAVVRRYPLSDTSLAARYARAISSYRFSDPASAAAPRLIPDQAQPRDP